MTRRELAKQRLVLYKALSKGMSGREYLEKMRALDVSFLAEQELPFESIHQRWCKTQEGQHTDCYVWRCWHCRCDVCRNQRDNTLSHF